MNKGTNGGRALLPSGRDVYLTIGVSIFLHIPRFRTSLGLGT